MTPALLDLAIAGAFSLLPERMGSPDARRMLHAIAWQESGLRHRRQVKGPARGYWQFEMGGLMGVARHHASSQHWARALDALDYGGVDPVQVHLALADNDVLAAVAARLLLFTLPHPLAMDEPGGWAQYMDAWRPGRPREEHWATAWGQATAWVYAPSQVAEA